MRGGRPPRSRSRCGRPSRTSSVALERILDQPRAADLLRRALASDRVAHAYAFIGPAGAGRMTTALAFAEALMGSAARAQPDLHVSVPTPPESNPRGARAIRIVAIRELERVASLRPAMARRKVFIIDEAERMTGETPQAFLKTLEEPPAATVIILILPRARAVPATLLSRCQVVRFGPRADAGSAAARAQALELLAEVRAQGVDALFRRTDRLEREKAGGLVGVETTTEPVLGEVRRPKRAIPEMKKDRAYPRVLRLATDDEARAYRDRREREERAIETCQRVARGRGLMMKVVDVEMHPV